MKLSRRDEKFLHRLGVLLATAIAMGIAVTMIKESHEVEKLVEPSIFRDMSLLFAPFAGLATFGYGLAHRSFSSGNLRSEAMGLLGSYSFFLSVAVPSFLKRENPSGGNCRFWQFFCSDHVLARDYRYTIVFALLGFALVGLALAKAGILGPGRRSID